MKSAARVLQAVVLSALIGSCAPKAAADPFADAPRPTRVDVLNRNFSDASVWAVSRSGRIRLGTVTGMSDGSFSFPWNGVEPVHMEIDLVGGQRCATDEIVVDEGDVLYLEIQPDLASMEECR